MKKTNKHGTKKRLHVALLLVIALFISVPVQALSIAAAPNLDSASSWARDEISQAVVYGLVPASLQSNYTAPATRAEFAALAVYLYEIVTGAEIEGRVTFADTNNVNVEKAAYLGIVQGVGNNMFSPNNPITREQAAVLSSRVAAVLDLAPAEDSPTFADNNLIAPWALEGVGHMQALGIMGGVGNNNFSPQGSYTREQSIITMLRLYINLAESSQPPVTPPSATPSALTIPNRVLTQTELNMWISYYHAAGGASEFEQEVLRLTNIERADNDLPPLDLSPTLMIAARFKAQSMYDIGYFDHTNPVYGNFYNISRNLFDYPVADMAENIASGHLTPEEVVAGWMDSDGHRENILDPYFTELGVGFHNNYWVQKFGDAGTADVAAPTGA